MTYLPLTLDLLVRMIAYGAILGIWNRHRGGLLRTEHTHAARASFSFMASCLVWFASDDPALSAGCFPLMWLGCLSGHGEYMWAGRAGGTWINDMIGLTISGFINYSPTAAWLAINGHVLTGALLVVAGTLGKPVLYHVGNRAHGTGEAGFKQGSELSELLYGIPAGISFATTRIPAMDVSAQQEWVLTVAAPSLWGYLKAAIGL